MSTIVSPRRRSRLPHPGWLALLTALLFTAGAGLSIWLPWRREHEIAERILAERAKGVGAGYEMAPQGPDWLRHVVYGKHCAADRIVRVTLQGRQVTDESLALLQGLTHVERLSLVETSVSDAGLAYLSGMTRLKTLTLDSNSVSDAGLVHLAGFRELKELYLGDTAITPEGCAHLAPVTKVRWWSRKRSMMRDTPIQSPP